MSGRKYLYCLIALLIFLTGFCFRYESATHTKVIQPIRADALEYVLSAFNLRLNGVYSKEVPDNPGKPITPDAARNPGYPLFLAAFIDKMPDEAMISKICLYQVIVSSLTLILSFILFRAFLPVPLALGGCLLAALTPHLIVANSYLLTETLFCFFVMLFVATMSLFWRRQSPWLLFAAGIMMGLSVLVRPGLQYFLPVVILFLAHQYGFKRGVWLGGIMMLGLCLVISPWIMRNLATLGVASDNTQMITFLHDGMYPDFVLEGEPRSYPYPSLSDPRTKEIEKDLWSVLSEIARRFHDEPTRHLAWYLIGKPNSLWSWSIVQGMGDVFIYPVSSSPYLSNPLFKSTHLVMHFLHNPLVVLAFAACMTVFFPLSRGNLPSESVATVRFISLLLLYCTAVFMMGYPDSRYTIPLRPLMYGMALFFPYIQFRLTMHGECEGRVRSCMESNAT
ncbi:MAG: glycosyltransferase family 39 protein [Syntrophobacter sp.]